MKLWVVVFGKAPEWHACTCSIPQAIQAVWFELSKLRFRGHNLFDGFFKIG